MTFSGMDAVEVVRAVGWLEERSVVYQVNGGWAVDALHGSQTRSHGDPDVFVDRRRVDEHIQITMRSGLGTVQSVNGPSAVDLVDD